MTNAKINYMGAILIAVATVLLSACSPTEETYDLVIIGGQVIDGSGAPAYRTDIGIKDGTIQYLGRGHELIAAKYIDASGLVVAPGFIDVHNHSEISFKNSANKMNVAFLLQGVTTVVVGNDGYIAPEAIKALKQYVSEHGTGTNVATYVGHNGIRTAVMGRSKNKPTADELEQMKALVREGMDEGAVGLSTGLMYAPGKFSDTQEVIALTREIAPYGGTHDTHVRNPVHDLIGSDKEAIEIGRQAGVGVKIGHIKLVGLPNKTLLPQVLKLISDAQAEGINVVTDQYPYDGAQTSELWRALSLPPELSDYRTKVRGIGARDRETLKQLLKDKTTRAQIAHFNETGGDGFTWIDAVGYTAMRVVHSPEKPELVGLHISELSETGKISGFEALTQVILETDQPVMITLGSIDEGNVQALLKQRWNMISSDGVWADSEGPQMQHPRATGSFPRVVGHYARDLGLLSVEEAVRKMTSLPASFLGLGKRGEITKGYVADITIFDADKIIDRSTWLEPGRMADGIAHVIVNGTLVVEGSATTGATSGQFIKLSRE